jgi:predicted component of type VI protein secretion system
MTIGRASDCTVPVPDLEMARQHAVLEQKDDELFIRDLGSMNRILVNKREVRETRLKHGDELELGRTRLVVQALVQAEMEGSPTAHRRRYRAAWAVAATLLLGLVLVLSARYVPYHSGPAATLPATTPAPTNPPTATDATPKVSDDLRGLRNEILAIQETVKTMAVRAATNAPAGPTAAPHPPPAPSLPHDEVAALFEAAQAAHTGGKLTEADALLARAQQLNPDFLPAYEERAAVLEKLGRRGESAAQWSDVLRRSIETPLYQKAVAERIRLSEAAAPEPAPDTPVLKIAQVQQNRFQATDDYDEMRVLNIALTPIRTSLRLDRDAVQVEITFYDRDPQTGAVEPTEARVAQETTQPTAAWGRASENMLSATYLVPHGLRAQQLAAGRARSFHGYRVRVFYRGRLQDETAIPKTLAGLPQPEITSAPTP